MASAFRALTPFDFSQTMDEATAGAVTKAREASEELAASDVRIGVYTKAAEAWAANESMGA